MPAHRYVLKGHTPVPTGNLSAWLAWFKSAKRTVAFTANRRGEAVCTVFLGLPAPGGEEDPPLLFQSLVVGGPLDKLRMLYATWDEAAQGHHRLVALVEGKGKGKAQTYGAGLRRWGAVRR